jgi:hypothetical protein
MEWGELKEGSARSRQRSGGLTPCQIRIMGALESCHNSKTECTPTNVRARYVELYGEKQEPPGKWERDARNLCQMDSIFTVNDDGSWALTAWRLKSGGRRYATLSGAPVVGESGDDNVASFGGKKKP